MTAIYDHKCEDCGPIIVETETISEYLDFKEEYGTSEGGNVQVPCPNCDKMAPRDYSAGTAPFKVKGGTLYKGRNYQRGSIRGWYREEINHTKEILRFKKGTSPYTGMSLKNPEEMGFKKCSAETAQKRADAARRTLGGTKARVDHNLNKR